jgi:glycopeptide antibiotics resistance protein
MVAVVNAYLIPLSTAAVVFPLIALALTIPYALYSYHRYGSISILRSLVLFSFVFYLQCAYYLVILPLPDPAEVATRTGAYYQLIPCYFVYDAVTHASLDPTTLSGWFSFLKSPYILEPVFNMLLTLPFGVYLSYYFKCSLKKVLILSFALSLFFELSQLSGLFGVYSRPYRIADVDDLILNTLGGALGYFIHTKFFRFLPNKEWMDKRSAERSVSVSYLRRLAAFFVDSVLIGLIVWLVTTLFAANGIILDEATTDGTWISIVVLLVYYPLFALLTRGGTPGKMLVRIRLDTVEGARPRWLLILLRYLLRNALIVGYQLLILLMRTQGGALGTYQSLFLLAVLLASALLLLDFFLSFRAKRGRRLWYEVLSKTRNVSSFPRC